MVNEYQSFVVIRFHFAIKKPPPSQADVPEPVCEGPRPGPPGPLPDSADLCASGRQQIQIHLPYVSVTDTDTPFIREYNRYIFHTRVNNM